MTSKPSCSMERLVNGRAQAVYEDAEIQRLSRLGLHPWVTAAECPFSDSDAAHRNQRAADAGARLTRSIVQNPLDDPNLSRTPDIRDRRRSGRLAVVRQGVPRSMVARTL